MTRTSRQHDAACPACGAPESTADRPFCSQGCRDRDLLRWLSDGHVLPGAEAGDEDEDALDSDARQSL